MFYGAVCHRLALVIEKSNDCGVPLYDCFLLARIIKICNLLCKMSFLIYRVDQGNPVVPTGPVVIFPKGRGRVDDTNSFFCSHISGRYYPECTSSFRSAK